MRRRVVVALAAFGASLSLAQVAGAQRFVPTADPKYPRIQFADSMITPNDRCMVSKSPLNIKVRPVYVNGVPMGFC
jgi:hypothetical protein